MGTEPRRPHMEEIGLARTRTEDFAHSPPLALVVFVVDGTRYGGVREVPSGSVSLTRALVPGLGTVAGIAALPEGLLFIHDLEAFLSTDDERSLDKALGAT